ncbi:2-oxoacid:ferredoxin oxidoreductase subunit beta [Temperatibacter marinus]|uniref:2-oxoacid:ferredoxin oxidoreductase subunit beta n=1 Tax=Temperatibacter marinus TaxID=1456591 RepID=A0AA52EGY3_9PROT|nr:2-oxoacid:ferredoxin oxidoreductase subunit beta [Temperatibacter marinus]WND01871.1 2-oxoacid:ferredoxin oxidoreductase subunit beta [Temperatibacter marinus]WND02968.1 2-oxoacid:ferredoxin oxidoreductase subunit beta [Temperatibacter marinus]
MTDQSPLTIKDFTSDQEVRWCPGCGDYAILKCMQRTLPEMGATLENTVFVSGIGCSSRFPYYMNTYGFHTIHGRAPAVATGLKLANPDLDVWLITGDGDGLSIGGNHTLHALRRNVDLNILLFNNKIYGLTKGQYSPTSEVGIKTPSTPMGSVDPSLNPINFALGCGAKFVARTVDTAQKHMPGVFKAAHQYKGAAFVEILQNCIVYNDDAWSDITDKKTAQDKQLLLEHGEKMIFGKEGNKGIVFDMDSFSLKVVTIGENNITQEDVLTHDESHIGIARLLAELGAGDGEPVAMGVLYQESVDLSYERAVHAQIDHARQKKKRSIKDIVLGGQTWHVK